MSNMSASPLTGGVLALISTILSVSSVPGYHYFIQLIHHRTVGGCGGPLYEIGADIRGGEFYQRRH
jgi:hypothetical protein